MKKYYGFTLSEVLVVLVVVGIIAALVIPPVYKTITEDRMKAKANKVLASLSNAISLRHTLTNITPDMYANTCGSCPEGGALAGYLLIDSTTSGAPRFVTGNAAAWNRPVLKTFGDCTPDGSNMVCKLANGAVVGFPTTGITGANGCITSAGGCTILVDVNGAGGPTITRNDKTPKDVSGSTTGGEPDLIQLSIKDSRVAPANKRTKNILTTGDATRPEVLP